MTEQTARSGVETQANGNGAKPPLPEAPASATIKFNTAEGFEVLFTVRDTEAYGLLTKRLPKAIAALVEMGATPVVYGKGGAKAEGPTKVCPIHGVPMRQFEKGGRKWWSHKDDDDEWCNGKGGGL